MSRVSAPQKVVNSQRSQFPNLRRKYSMSEILCNIPVSRRFREQFFKLFPKLDKNRQDLMSIFYALAFSGTPFKDEWGVADNKELFKRYCGQKIFSSHLGIPMKNIERYIKIQDFLDEFMLTFPGVITEIISPDYKKNIATQVCLTWQDEFWSFITEEKSVSISRKENPVYFTTGEIYIKEDSKSVKRLKRTINGTLWAEEDQPEEAKDLATRYISTISLSRYKPNIGKALRRLNDSLNAERNPIARRKIIQKILIVSNLWESFDSMIYELTKPFEARIYAKGASFQGLPADLRMMILDDCDVFDISSCQIRIAAKELEFKELLDFINRNPKGDIYQFILDKSGFQNAEHSKKEIRDFIKLMTLVVTFAAGEKKMEILAEEMGFSKSDVGLLINKSSILGRLKSAIAKKNKQIEEDGGLTFINGKFHEISDRYNAPSLFALRVQQIERMCIEACYEVASRNRDRYTIVSHEHDGFSIRINNRKEKNTVLRELSDALSVRAKQLGGYSLFLSEKGGMA